MPRHSKKHLRAITIWWPSKSSIPEEVVVGDGVVFVTHVANRGTDAIPPRTYRVDLYVDSECVSFDHGTGGLRPGGTSTYSMSEGYYHFKPTEPGTYTYRWMLDKEENLPETDETNNVIEGTIVVAERSAEHDKRQAAKQALLDQLELIGENMVEGHYPPELKLSPDSTHKELQWFTDLFEEYEVKVYSGDYYYNYLTPRESDPPRERATHRLAFRNMSESEWPALFVHYFDGQEWAKQATSEFYRDNQVTVTPQGGSRRTNRYFPSAGIEQGELSFPGREGLAWRNVDRGRGWRGRPPNRGRQSRARGRL